MVDPPSILDDLPVGVWVGRVPDGAPIYANPACERIMGMPQVPHRAVADWSETYGLVGRDGRPYPTEKLPFARVVATGAPVVVDDVVLVRPGGNVNLRAFGTPVSDPDGKLASVIVVFLDITAEVAAQLERKRVEDHLRFACDHAPIAIWTTDEAGVITMSEGAGLAALGVKSGQMVGQNVFDAYRAYPTIVAQLRRGLAGESFWYTVDVGKVTYHTWLAPLRGPDGAVVGLSGLSHDITELHKLQESSIQNDRMMALGTLAASVAHEINNPLTYVLAHGEQVASEVETLEKLLLAPAGADRSAALASLRRLREALGPVRSGTARIGAITRDLRTFSRPEENTLVPVDLRGVVLSVLRLVAKEVEARARLVLDLQQTPPVTANEGRLVQVVLNLVVNAMQALPGNSAVMNEVHVRTGHGGGQVFVEVSDSGPGVPLANRERIFEPFFSTKEIGSGTGLGLFVCRNIVRGLSGEVTVGDRPGGGACFRVSLPASASNAPERATPEPVAPAAPAGRHVVLIEDDSMVARALTLQLRMAGYRVTAIADGKAGMETLRARPDVDLVFCDLMMTGMNGMDLAEALAIEVPEIARKMVFMTGGAFSPRAREFVAKHLDRTVDKPFDVVAEAQRRLDG